jgi:cation diffusion facilitator CzcD-associated flavoprotein CzcO
MTRTRYSRVAVIGGGPGGLAAAKALSLEPVNLTIDLFERGTHLGGIWYYNKRSNDKFISPMYKYLETNLQTNLMEYSNVHFKGHNLFVSRTDVYDYLCQYIETISGCNFHLNHNVIKVVKIDDTWQVTVHDLELDVTSILTYDAVIVANGHFNKPYIPHVEGLDTWDKEFVIHSNQFIESGDYCGLNVLVVGNSSSGIDIAVQVSTTANKVYVSAREHAIADPLFTNIGIINKYDFPTRSVTTDDGTYNNIDKIIFCTGYEYDVPFLQTYSHIVTPFQIKDLYKQVFYIYDTSLSFVCINKNIVPMPVSESQASVIARVYSGRIALPETVEMEQDYHQELLEKGEKIHIFEFPKDVEYYNQFQTILDNNPETKESGLLPPVWSDKKIKDRGERVLLKHHRILQAIQFAHKLKENGEEYRLMD